LYWQIINKRHWQEYHRRRIAPFSSINFLPVLNKLLSPLQQLSPPLLFDNHIHPTQLSANLSLPVTTFVAISLSSRYL
jgi:hypothetical protein